MDDRNKEQKKTGWWMLVVSTHLKNISQNGKSSPNRGKNRTYLKPPSRRQLTLFGSF